MIMDSPDFVSPVQNRHPPPVHAYDMWYICHQFTDTRFVFTGTGCAEFWCQFDNAGCGGWCLFKLAGGELSARDHELSATQG